MIFDTLTITGLVIAVVLVAVVVQLFRNKQSDRMNSNAK